VPAVLAGCYYALALVAALLKKPTHVRPTSLPPVSILKPVHGWDDRLADAIDSHLKQDFPEYELLLGVRADDLGTAEEIRQRFPGSAVRIIPVTTVMPNGKVGSLMDLAAAAKYPILIINDADICVAPDYLTTVTGPLSKPQIGLVTALYRATATSFAAQFEALGVATEFAPSVLVARLLGVAEFALGSTMAIRVEDLQRMGGFRAIGDYLADDYQLGAHITRLGLHVEFADTIVETTLGGGSWPEVWKHQVRWSRTIRVSRPSGYYGYVITQATFWAAVAALAGYWQVAIGVLAVRIAAGGVTASAVLRDNAATARWWMIPFRDVFGFAVWLSAAFGRTVEWRGMQLRLTRDGRIRLAGN
jgi:ceramide glucosyltransferase